MRTPLNVDDMKTDRHLSRAAGEAAWEYAYFTGGTVGEGRSTSVYYTVEPGRRLGWHRNSAEEVQFFIAGSGDLLLDGESFPVRGGDMILLDEGTHHDIRNTGNVILRAIGFFPEPEVSFDWTEEDRPAAAGGAEPPEDPA